MRSNTFKVFLSFDDFLFPRIVPVLYFLGLVLIVLGGIGGIVGGIAAAMDADALTGIVIAVGALVGMIVGAVVLRLVIELWLVIFSINDNLATIRRQERKI